jgi:hypothetical protein
LLVENFVTKAILNLTPSHEQTDRLNPDLFEQGMRLLQIYRVEGAILSLALYSATKIQILLVVRAFLPFRDQTIAICCQKQFDWAPLIL